MNLRPVFYLELEDGRRVPVINQTDAMLLRYIHEMGSISKAAKKVGISYRAAWERINSLERKAGFPVVIRKVGGEEGGGAKLTEKGLELLRFFRRVRKYIFNALEDIDSWQSLDYKISARNKIKVRILKVEKGEIVSLVRMKILKTSELTSLVSTQAVEELKIKEGEEAFAIIKATEVLIGKV